LQILFTLWRPSQVIYLSPKEFADRNLLKWSLPFCFEKNKKGGGNLLQSGLVLKTCRTHADWFYSLNQMKISVYVCVGRTYSSGISKQGKIVNIFSFLRHTMFITTSWCCRYSVKTAIDIMWTHEKDTFQYNLICRSRLWYDPGAIYSLLNFKRH
jgi:hypothetical protein